ncbi:UNVERIFIED_ORG: hypothetical protein E4P37_17730 [Bacillus sp. AZ43]
MRNRRWHRIIGVATVLGALVVISVAAMPSGPPDSSGPQTCFEPPSPPDTPGTVEAGTALFEANRLAEAGNLGLAEELYTSVLAEDVRAVAGLEHVAARRGAAERVAASAQRVARAGLGDIADRCFQRALALDPANAAAREGLTPDERVLPQRAEDRWDAFYARWIGPLGAALLPALGVLAVVLVVARLLTPSLAPGSAVAWPDWIRRTAWSAGLVLAVLAVLRGIALLGWPPPWVDGIDAEWRSPVAAGLAGAILLIAWLGTRAGTTARFGDQAYRLGLPAAVTAAFAVVGAALALLLLGLFVRPLDPILRIPDDVWPWTVTAGIAVLGIVLLAVGRGHALRLRVMVNTGDKADPAATAYVLARLQDLGTSPPEGLKTPQQVDVTDLPTEAVKGLPVGRVATVLASTLGLLQPSVPWRATVEDHEDGWMTVAVARNGSVVRTAIIDGERFREPPATEGAKAGPGPSARNRLTAAAAVILTEMSVRHPRLARGLCGATQWDSVAAHVVATRPPDSPTADDGFRSRLQAFAVQRDPRNALARAAYVQGRGPGADTPEAFRAHAARLEGLCKVVEWQRRDPHGLFDHSNDVPPPARSDDDGYLPLRLRIAHATAAAWLNAAAYRQEGSTDREKAQGALDRFRELLEACGASSRSDTFVREMSAVFGELQVALRVLQSDGESFPSPDDPTWFRPRSLQALYDRACALAMAAEMVGRDGATTRSDLPRSLAREDLSMATGHPRLLERAATDPWLRSVTPPSR